MDRARDNTAGSVTQGEQLKLRGLRLATNASSDFIISKIDAAISLLAQTGSEFTADQVWEMLNVYHYKVEHPNVVGARFLKARRNGKIREVGYKRSERASRHAARLIVYVGT